MGFREDLDISEIALRCRTGHMAATFASRARERGDQEEAVRWDAVLAAVGAIVGPEGPRFDLFGDAE
jgi:hypothetical protein